MKYWDYSVKGHNRLEGWAKILITEDGRFHAISDYGNFSYWWTCIGEGRTILEFVHGICDDPYYICQKLKPTKERDDAKSFKSLKDQILADRRTKSLSAEDALEKWLYLKDFDSWEDFLRDDFTYDHFKDWDLHEFEVREYCSDIRAFAKHVMPALALLLQKDISEKAP